MEPKVATIEADLQHPSLLHKGNDLGVLPVGAAFGPSDDANTYISCVFIAKLNQVGKVIPYLFEQFLVSLYFGFAVGIVLVNSVPRRTTRARDRSKDCGGDFPVAVVRIFGVGKPSGGCGVDVFCNACGDAVSILVIPFGIANEGIFTAAPFDDVATTPGVETIGASPPPRRSSHCSRHGR